MPLSYSVVPDKSRKPTSAKSRAVFSRALA